MVVGDENANASIDLDGETIAKVNSSILEPSRQVRAAAQKTSKQD